MADMFAPLVAQLKANPKTIVFTEGNDPRILEAASKLLAEGVLKVVMVGNEAECKAAAAAGNFDISAAEIIDPENYAGFDEMVNTMVELRKGKQTAEECTAMLKKSNYFGTMLVKMGKADCLLGGATYSTADTIRPALQLVKTKKGAHLVSSCFILDRDCGEEGLKRIAMGDCAVNIDYIVSSSHEKSIQWLVPLHSPRVADRTICLPFTFTMRLNVPSFHFFRLPIMHNQLHWRVCWKFNT